MKKALSFLLITLLLAATLIACAEAPEPEEILSPVETEMPEPEEATDTASPITLLVEADASPYGYELCFCGEHYVNEELQEPTPPLNMYHLSDDQEVKNTFLSAFETVHTVTYLQIEKEWYSILVFWPDVPLHDFSLLSLGFYDAEDGRTSFYTREVLLDIDELLPTDALVLNVVFAHYLTPRSGLIFTDENNEQKRMFITESMRGGCFPSIRLIPYVESQFIVWHYENIEEIPEDSAPAMASSEGFLANGVRYIFNADFNLNELRNQPDFSLVRKDEIEDVIIIAQKPYEVAYMVGRYFGERNIQFNYINPPYWLPEEQWTVMVYYCSETDFWLLETIHPPTEYLLIGLPTNLLINRSEGTVFEFVFFH